MIPRLKPVLEAKELRAALNCHSDNDVEAFENAFAEVMGQSYAIAFPYGRTALIFLLKALGLEGKEVICPAYTCVVVPHAVVYSNNFPVFVDCEATGFNMDLEKAEAQINERTGAIIATSLFGYPVDLDKLDEIRTRHPNLHIIQDCAHSFSAEWKGRQVQREGVAAIFGLNISKLVTSIFGGMVTTDDKKLNQRLKYIRDQKLFPSNKAKDIRRLLYLLSVYPCFYSMFYGIVNRLERSKLLDYFVRYYDDAIIDMPRDYQQQISPVEVRTGLANLKRYRKIIEDRRSAAKFYFIALKSSESFKLPPDIPGATYSHFVVQVKNRDRWLEMALRKEIQLGRLIDYNIPEMLAYKKQTTCDYPISRKYSHTTINIPIWGGVKMAKKVVQQLFA